MSTKSYPERVVHGGPLAAHDQIRPIVAALDRCAEDEAASVLFSAMATLARERDVPLGVVCQRFRAAASALEDSGTLNAASPDPTPSEPVPEVKSRHASARRITKGSRHG